MRKEAEYFCGFCGYMMEYYEDRLYGREEIKSVKCGHCRQEVKEEETFILKREYDFDGQLRVCKIVPPNEIDLLI